MMKHSPILQQLQLIFLVALLFVLVGVGAACPVAPPGPGDGEPGACQQDQDCTAPARCQKGRCLLPPGLCLHESDCPPNHLCLNGVCLQTTPPQQCQSNQDCLRGSYCHKERCRKGCVRDSECPSGQFCLCPAGEDCNQGGVRRCMRECSTSADCLKLDARRPVCLEKKGRCVLCQDNKDCPPPGGGSTSGDYCLQEPLEKPLQWSCVACLDDKDCTDGQCQNHRCIGFCDSQKTCQDPARPYCDSAKKRCAACLFDKHCPGGKRCHPSLGECVVCSRDDHCPSHTPRCDAKGNCVGCLDDKDCTEKTHPHCQSPEQRCVACLKDDDCQAQNKKRCTPAYECVSCLADSDCPQGEHCTHKECLQGCLEDKHCKQDPFGRHKCDPYEKRCVACAQGTCPEGEFCDPDPTSSSYRSCLPGCRSDLNCGTSSKTPHCWRPNNQKIGRCVGCYQDSHCPPQQTCQSTSLTCQPKPGRCQSNKDCKSSTNYCDKKSGKCVSCSKRSDCDNDRVCVLGNCIENMLCGPVGGPCKDVTFLEFRWGEQTIGNQTEVFCSLRCHGLLGCPSPGLDCRTVKEHKTGKKLQLCVPRRRSVSCTLWRQTGRQRCSTPTDCGLPQEKSALCKGGLCTFACSLSLLKNECPEGTSCNLLSSVCQ